MRHSSCPKRRSKILEQSIHNNIVISEQKQASFDKFCRVLNDIYFNKKKCLLLYENTNKE